MNIRPRRQGDYSEILEIYALSKLDELKFEENHFDLIPLNEDSKRLARFEESDVFVYDEGQVIGFVAQFGAEISSLFVHPKARGRGIGKCLLEYVLQQISGTATLHVAKSNIVAKSLYERYGFEIVCEFEASYAGVSVAANTMKRYASNRTNASRPATGAKEDFTASLACDA